MWIVASRRMFFCFSSYFSDENMKTPTNEDMSLKQESKASQLVKSIQPGRKNCYNYHQSRTFIWDESGKCSEGTISNVLNEPVWHENSNGETWVIGIYYYCTEYHNSVVKQCDELALFMITFSKEKKTKMTRACCKNTFISKIQGHRPWDGPNLQHWYIIFEKFREIIIMWYFNIWKWNASEAVVKISFLFSYHRELLQHKTDLQR